MKLPLPPNAKPEPTADVAVSSDDFSDLMHIYAETKEKLEDLKEEISSANSTLDNLKGSMKEVAQNMNLAKGSTFKVDGAGKFNWTTVRGFQLKRENREEFVRLLIERGEIALLSIQKGDLQEWCKQVVDDYDEDDPTSFRLPSYISYFEDPMVPRVALEKKKG